MGTCLNAALRLHQDGQQGEAKRLCHHLLAQDPHHLEALILLGIVTCKLSQFEESVLCFKQALNLKPNDSNIYNNLGNVFKAQGNLDEAISNYYKAISITPNHTDAFFNLGVAFTELGDLETAAKQYQRVLAINPNSQNARQQLNRILVVRQGRFEG